MDLRLTAIRAGEDARETIVVVFGQLDGSGDGKLAAAVTVSAARHRPRERLDRPTRDRALDVTGPLVGLESTQDFFRTHVCWMVRSPRAL